MEKEKVDEAIDLYVSERMAKGKERALSHFLARVYLKQQGEIADAMRQIRGMTRYYIDLTRVTLNPFKGPELAWFFSMINIAIYAVILLRINEQRTLGILLLSGALVNGCYLVRSVLAKRCELHVMLAIYLELIQITEHELETLA